MAYTVQTSFDSFYTNINLSGDHREVANKRKDSVVSILGKKFEIIESFASGSIPRYTALSGHADLDIIVVLHYGKHVQGKKPSMLLQEVRDVLSEHKTNVRKNGQAVTLYYQTWPNVDIVPCSRSVDDSGNVTHYSIPNMNDESWIKSRPKKHSANMISKAGECGPNFRKIVTMAKHWNRAHSGILQSYHVETLALRIFESKMSDIAWDALRFFTKASELVSSNLWYEGAYSDEYLSWSSRNEAEKRLISARDKARSAWYNTQGSNKDHKNAILIWRQIFGEKFPAYG